MQEAYIAVWRRAASFDAGKARAMTWLITIARNQAVDRYRTLTRVSEHAIDLADDVADPQPGAVAAIESSEEDRRLAACLERLGIADHRLICTAFFEGSSYREIAVRTATPEGTVKTRMRRTLAILRACMQ